MINAWINNTEVEKLRNQNKMMKALMEHLFKEINKLREDNENLKDSLYIYRSNKIKIDEPEIVNINELLDLIAKEDSD